MSNFHFKLDSDKNGPTYRKWVVNSRHQTMQNHQLQTRNYHVEYHINKSKHDTKEFQYLKRMSLGINIQGGVYLQNQNYLGSESLNM